MSTVCKFKNVSYLSILDVKVWWGVSVLLAALISWSLQSRHDLIMTLENCDGLISIMKALQFVCVQDLTQVSTWYAICEQCICY